MMQPTNSVQARVMRTSRTSSCKTPEQEETHQPRSGQPRNTPPQLQVHREVCRSKLSSSRPMAQEQCTANQQRHNTSTRGSAGQDDCQGDCLAGISESLLQRQPIFFRGHFYPPSKIRSVVVYAYSSTQSDFLQSLNSRHSGITVPLALLAPKVRLR